MTRSGSRSGSSAGRARCGPSDAPSTLSSANPTSTRPEDLIFEGYELGDALDRANEALEDDVNVLEADGRPADARPFTRKEVLPLLERWFFNR